MEFLERIEQVANKLVMVVSPKTLLAMARKGVGHSGLEKIAKNMKKNPKNSGSYKDLEKLGRSRSKH